MGQLSTRGQGNTGKRVVHDGMRERRGSETRPRLLAPWDPQTLPCRKGDLLRVCKTAPHTRKTVKSHMVFR